jgi:hypothetical protein
MVFGAVATNLFPGVRFAIEDVLNVASFQTKQSARWHCQLMDAGIGGANQLLGGIDPRCIKAHGAA